MKSIPLNQISQELCAYLKENIVDQNLAIDFDTPFAHIGIDSLSTIALVLFIERKYNVALSEKELIPENFISINTLALCTQRYLK